LFDQKLESRNLNKSVYFAYYDFIFEIILTLSGQIAVSDKIMKPVIFNSSEGDCSGILKEGKCLLY